MRLKGVSKNGSWRVSSGCTGAERTLSWLVHANHGVVSSSRHTTLAAVDLRMVALTPEYVVSCAGAKA